MPQPTKRNCAANTIIFAFGTRPEAIKFAPLIKRFQAQGGGTNAFRCRICLTGQHSTLLYPFMREFGLFADYDLKVMKDKQDLCQLTVKILNKVKVVLDKEKPSLVFVLGDTISALAVAITCFYNKIPLAHLEAGLRTYDKYAPWPEEVMRILISHLADWHFCPTKQAQDNLIKENIAKDHTFVVGNTIVDALDWITKHGV